MRNLQDLKQNQLEIELSGGQIFDVRIAIMKARDAFLVQLRKQTEKIEEVWKAMIVCPGAKHENAEKAYLVIKQAEDVLFTIDNILLELENELQKTQQALEEQIIDLEDNTP